MKKNKILLVTVFAAIIGLITIAADHIDAPAVSGTSADITDFYAFQGENTSNLVFVANVQGLLSPSATASASFDENVMVEFNIDTNQDNVEDFVIQAIPRDGKMYFFGPFTPSVTGLNSTVNENATMGEVAITSYNASAVIGSNSSGMKFFAGPRDDPFFMDFARYGEIIGGNASGFNNPGSDTFAGTNVLSIVVEVPKSMIGTSGTINTWVEAKSKQ
ncbi:molecular chaperone DnaK [Polaribacter aquimarinus]|uniref:Molecular chaperone DnaK n=1 Tax=Polaribacter aquimarinus TaxID=2100726 RepID=A0A2U2JAT6_9FLAO|nr:molecular chaperone DnaK [Polaribacter aquimarinus]